MGGTFYLKSSDTAPVIEATLTDSTGSPINLTGASVRFAMLEPRGAVVTIDTGATIADTTNGVVRYSWAEEDTATPGRYRAEFVVTYEDGSVETFPNVGYHDIIISQ
ncbi:MULTISPECIES: BppU family phage baseplate upper protein [Haloarcula]|uniref:BppU family phage baseplate upper protein n=1 Tax=Haloarcula TaxID=2237 RepID=UPI000F8F4AA9|nr:MULTISPECIES: BppU family phage baseplate upper protein [Haloarcula]NHX41392.1 BppU family phage baseplate upper protein [Haloarcula sp. R1-2]